MARTTSGTNRATLEKRCKLATSHCHFTAFELFNVGSTSFDLHTDRGDPSAER
jgi:hypothetical protein